MTGERVTAEFDDGSKATADMVIGCDGSHSKVREFLVGLEQAELTDVGMTLINYAASNYTPEQARLLRSYHPIIKLGFHPTNPAMSLIAGMSFQVNTGVLVMWAFCSDHRQRSIFLIQMIQRIGNQRK